jgi:hypothetical protein
MTAKFGVGGTKINFLFTVLAKSSARITRFCQRVPVLVALKLEQITMCHPLLRLIIDRHVIMLSNTMSISNAALSKLCLELCENKKQAQFSRHRCCGRATKSEIELCLLC